MDLNREDVKCPNYIVCGSMLPEWVLCCHSGTCRSCNVKYGTWKRKIGKGNILTFIDNIECPVCLETGRGVQQVFCDHYLCINCFKTMYEKDYTRDYSKEPPFPYPELKAAYYDQDNDDKWKEYPLITKWQDKWDEWYNDELKTPQSMTLCPLCRTKAIN